MSSDPAAAVWRRRDDVLWRRSLDAVILLPVGADEPITLPGTGAAVWDLLEEPASLDELVATLAEAYEEDPAVVEHDVIDPACRNSRTSAPSVPLTDVYALDRQPDGRELFGDLAHSVAAQLLRGVGQRAPRHQVRVGLGVVVAAFPVSVAVREFLRAPTPVFQLGQRFDLMLLQSNADVGLTSGTMRHPISRSLATM